MSNSWKGLERKTAELLGGTRVMRGADFSKSAPDVILPDLTPEVKYRSEAPMFYYNYLSVLRHPNKYSVIYHKDRIALMLASFSLIYKGDTKPLLIYEIPSNKKKYSKFLEDSLIQAEKYDSNKIPLVVFKHRGSHGEIVYMSKENFNKIYERVKI